MSEVTRYKLALLTALAAAIPLVVCKVAGINPPDWLLFPCVVVMTGGASIASAIRMSNT